MKKYLILASALFIGAQWPSLSFADEPNVVGSYTCRGTNFISQENYESKLGFSRV